MANNYQGIRDSLKTGDCILTKGTGIISRLIRLFTEYSHAYIVVRPERYKELNDRVFLLEAQATGVRFVLLSNIVQSYKGQIDIFQPKGLTDEMRNSIVLDAMIAGASQIKYNFGGLFANLFGRTSTSLKKYFCSELVWVKWLKCGFIKTDSPALTDEGVMGLSKGVSPRPGDIPKWVYGDLIRDIKK